MPSLAELVSDFAAAMVAVDAKGVQAESRRSGRKYHPGIGPYAEPKAVQLITDELRTRQPERYATVSLDVQYETSRMRCDLVVGAQPEWAVEVKMARLSGDNGKPDDTSIKDILSPYQSDRSAVSDCSKLATNQLAHRSAILIYGFEDERRPLCEIIDAFEVLAGSRVRLGPRESCAAGPLVHPVFREGHVFAWEVLGVLEEPEDSDKRGLEDADGRANS